ncbi:sodium/calcium exchanger protein-like protein [Cucurbitaria berberidis CBS 394.84]|uniref:Sodium/calcium exchanger protein-like protein n=1 Tax=Cucurbitaria berberidis CBS 394.84 TaxID=1168544 RepID=A0A9P4GHK1_9PLEO|nr:sodium/calcium exchanger protein-like protein [Cucurbitaria berberidis CBS 394.84]KAF1845551.1 sodium/calcium exchanger protein-like protein [Cucurbitaria berberidis CBS 394.84]
MNDLSILETAQKWRRPRYSARPFALTILAITLISLLAWAKGPAHKGSLSAGNTLRKRDVSMLDEECRLVHQAADQCAFVLANCPDEEAGVISYLTFYYCRLPHAKPVAFVILALWLGMLFSTIGIAASDFFCVNLNTISLMLGMSESLAGVTLLALGNGSPDVFSTFAAFRTNAASLAIGELIGAACFITAVVSGSMALIRPFNVARRSFVRDVAFFLIAAAFSMGFIADGQLHLWESITMVAFYIFYVAFVVAWHWWLNQRKARRLKAAAMRSQYIIPGDDEEEIPEYHDEETTAGSTTPGRGISVDDFSALERAGGGGSIDEDDNEEERERWMGELTNNMRVSRPNITSRRNTHTPIRPSLVGALEFRAVLSSLQKSRNIQSMPISLRRYSDDPTYTTAQQQDNISRPSDPAARPPFDVASISSDASPHVIRPNMEIQQNMGNRARAVSTNDIDNVRLHPSTLQEGVPDITFGPATPNERSRLLTPGYVPPTRTSPPASQHSSRATSPAPPRVRHPSYNRLVHGVTPVRQGTASPSPFSSPVLEPGERPQPPSLKLAVPDAMSPTIPFPAFNEYPWSAHSSRPPSLHARSPSASPESVFPKDPFGFQNQARTPRWWPSRLLPTPNILLSTLFPTLTNWHDKSIFDKVLGVVASLPVFLLTITLPVVEQQKDDNDGGHAELSLDFGLPSPRTPINGSMDSHSRSISIVLPPESSADMSLSKAKKATSAHKRSPNGGSMSTTASQPPEVYITSADAIAQSPEQLPAIPSLSEPKQWNRWLVIVQIFTAPFFIVLILWANLEPDNPRTLLRHTLYSLVGSLCVLAFVLITTTPDRPPRWRSLLCFLGFAVAIAWISTIANEVVGVLRTLGVVLNMSDAILGLTIFAVGNSLGDLVADITVARLGFPIMALSACFGGPMLNILLGIGLSGCYMTITTGEHKHEKHPDQPVRFKPYHIAVSTTLVISGATLLFTLAGLLVAVPMRRWKMDKTIGWGLVAVWSISTFANVLVEVLGYSSDVS